MRLARLSVVGIAVVLGIYFGLGVVDSRVLPKKSWDQLPRITMAGGLRIFWSVYTGEETSSEEAELHGFLPLTEVATYADYPGNQKHNIVVFLGHRNRNPWNKPPFFESIIRRNIDSHQGIDTFVHDIEFDFEENADQAWADETVRVASGAKDFATFEEAYFREWASWYWLPLKWTKERYPDSIIGLYGPQPFRRDYWGVTGKDAAQIDGTHHNDVRLWKFIDRFVDFYVASIYVFYDRPDSVFYMAANVEENYVRTRAFGDKPLYAYEWLRYHDSNQLLNNGELDSYLVEAMAVIPFFSGARAIVLWGYEPHMKHGDGLPYAMLPVFMESLRRVARLSNKIGQSRLVIEEPAHVLWKQRRSLTRKMNVGASECLFMTINPWQSETQSSSVPVQCGENNFQLEMIGRQTAIYHINGSVVVRY